MEPIHILSKQNDAKTPDLKGTVGIAPAGVNMNTKMDMEELFVRKKPVRLLLNIKMGGAPKYVSILAKETDCTYSHTVKLLDIFKALGIVEFEKHGRIKFVKLTAEGHDLGQDFESVLRKFSKLKIRKKV